MVVDVVVVVGNVVLVVVVLVDVVVVVHGPTNVTTPPVTVGVGLAHCKPTASKGMV